MPECLINVTLLFSREQYVAAAEAFLRGIERRIDAGLKPDVGSVASVFISRWDAAIAGKVPAALNNKLGIAIAKRTYKAYRDLLGSPRWQRIYNAGARPQRLLWASTGTKDPKASDVLYIKALAAPFTVNTMPEGTLKALADHGDVSEIMSADGGDYANVFDQFATAGIDLWPRSSATPAVGELGNPDPKASDVLYIKALAAPFTVNTMPEGTLKALADHGESAKSCRPMVAIAKRIGAVRQGGIDVDALAARLQDEGAKSFVNSWNELMGVIASKSATLAKAS